MRIIFATWAWPSHLHAMVPLAWACRAAGHEVRVASQPALTDAVLRTGLHAAPVGRDVDALAVFRTIVRTPAPSPAGKAPGKGGGPRVLKLLGTLADAMADDLIALARDWRAHLIVFEPTAFAGPLAAAALGIPAVRHLYGTDLMSAVGRFLPGVLDPLRERLGLDEVDPFGTATVDPCPSRLQVPTGSRRLPMRYIPFAGLGTPPRGLPARTGRPRVCVTWGNTPAKVDPGLLLTGQVAQVADALGVEVVAAVTAAQRPLLGPVPPGVHVVEDTPLDLLLPGCDLVVAHGGAGTILTGLVHGLPQLHIPRLPDHVRHAARLAETGAAEVIPAPVEHEKAIGDRLTEMLGSPAYRAAAAELSQDLRRQPTPAEVVGELERIAACPSPSTALDPRTSRARSSGASLRVLREPFRHGAGGTP